MTTKFINKIYTFFQDEDEAAIVCNILEHINTDDAMMVEILTTNLVVNGYLQKIIDFFKWVYPNMWIHFNNMDDSDTPIPIPITVSVLWSSVVRRIINDNVGLLTFGETHFIGYATQTEISVSPFKNKWNEPDYITIGSGCICLSSYNDIPVELEVPYMVNRLYVSGSFTHGRKYTFNFNNFEDVKLLEWWYDSLHFVIKGMSKLQYVSELKLLTTPHGESLELPQMADALYLYNLSLAIESLNIKANFVYIRDALLTKIVSVNHHFDTIIVSGTLALTYLIKNIRESNNIVRKIIYHSKDIESLPISIVEEFINVGYGVLRNDDAHSNSIIFLSNSNNS